MTAWFDGLEAGEKKFFIILAVFLAVLLATYAHNPDKYKVHSTYHDQCVQANTDNGTDFTCPD
jgi:hypothetical protein